MPSSLIYSQDNPINVQMLGRFCISCVVDGETHTVCDTERASQKRWSLIEFLILNRGRVTTKEELWSTIWPGSEQEDLNNALKTLIHRVRLTLNELYPGLGKDLLLCRAGNYYWNPRVPLNLDIDEFDRRYAMIESSRTQVEWLDRALRTIQAYTGPFLPRSAHEAWAAKRASDYRERYVQLCCDICEPMTAQKRTAQLCETLRRALQCEPYEERLHQALIRALIANGERSEAMARYNTFNNLMLSRGESSSDQIADLYRELVNTTQPPDMDLNAVRERMAKDDSGSGAFFCEYGLFREIYQLVARQALRGNDPVQLAMISVLSGRPAPLTGRRRKAAMDRLRAVIAATLRAGDSVTLFSPTQYLLLLPGASEADGNLVLARVIRTFRRNWPKMSIILHYSLLPVLPKQEKRPLTGIVKLNQQRKLEQARESGQLLPDDGAEEEPLILPHSGQGDVPIEGGEDVGLPPRGEDEAEEPLIRLPSDDGEDEVD